MARGLLETRAQAQAAIAAGRVRVNGAPARKASQSVPADAEIEAEPAHPWVSRGGVKLAHALDVFGVDPAGKACLDVGASTGGFTDVLLARGADRVVCVDVGRGQLHPRLAADLRVASYEATDARTLTAQMLGGAIDLVVCDASFIGLMKVIARPLGLASATAELVALFKPQFEVGRAHVGKGGLVTNAVAVDAALQGVGGALSEMGWDVAASTVSPITGGDGNTEHLIWARRRA